MPLEAEHERVLLGLDRLDDAVGAPRHGAQPPAEGADRLVMDGVDDHLGRAEDAREAARRVDADLVLVIVNLDPNHTQSGWTALDVATLGLPADEPYQVHDLLTDARYIWHGSRNFVMLDPARVPAHVFRVRRRVQTERDFDYFA